ncbi:MAG: SRPBCC domain-containing protein [Caulobacter sp.]|nr:SRPBCC domain-containing protein [Caulobacter sp.]
MQRAVEFRTGVQAPAEIVWEVVSDFAAWKDWNPVHPRMEGEMRIGTPLRFDLVIGDAPAKAVEAVVQDWVPYEQLHWRTKRLNGFVTAIRYLEIENMGPANATFSNGELFMGPLVRWVSRDERRRLKAAFTLMGEAVRARAETLWSERQNTPT